MLAGYASSTRPCAASCGLALRAGTATTTGSTAGLAKRDVRLIPGTGRLCRVPYVCHMILYTFHEVRGLDRMVLQCSIGTRIYFYTGSQVVLGAHHN